MRQCNLEVTDFPNSLSHQVSHLTIFATPFTRMRNAVNEEVRINIKAELFDYLWDLTEDE
mgnify:CR=1 FL=1